MTWDEYYDGMIQKVIASGRQRNKELDPAAIVGVLAELRNHNTRQDAEIARLKKELEVARVKNASKPYPG